MEDIQQDGNSSEENDKNFNLYRSIYSDKEDNSFYELYNNDINLNEKKN